MSISKDEKFMKLLEEVMMSSYKHSNGFKSIEDVKKITKEFIDYIDDYADKKYEEGIETEKDIRRCYG